MPTRPPIFRSRFQPTRPADHLVRGSAAERGYDATWRRFRDYAIRRPENILCRFRDHPAHRHECTHASTILDHIVPLPKGERLSVANVRGVCRRAHEVLTATLKATGRNEMPAGPGLERAG